MYAELVFPAGTTIPEMTRDVVRVITTSDGAGAANNSILEFADNVNSNIVDTVASEWTLDPAFTLATGAAGVADQRYMVQQPHQNGSTKTVMIGSFQQNPTYINTNTSNFGMGMGMVYNRGAADPAYEAYTSFTGGTSTASSGGARYTHSYAGTEDKTLVIWAQPRSIGMIGNNTQTNGITIEAGLTAIIENVDTYESKWRGVAQPQQALFCDFYAPTVSYSANSTNMADFITWTINTTTSNNYPLVQKNYLKPQIYFQNMFWDKYYDRLMALTWWHQYPIYAYGSGSNSYYNDGADTFGYWYRDETDSMGLYGFTADDGNATSSYHRLGLSAQQSFFTGSTPRLWHTDGGSIIYGNRSFHNHWQYHAPKDGNGDPAVQLMPVVYRLGDEARYQDFSSEAGFYYATPNFKDGEHMYYKFLTDAAGDTFLMFYSDYADSWSSGGYAIKVS